jgi:hypothetical protein
MHRSVALGLSRRSETTCYYSLSIDEKAVHKGHKYVSILSDSQTGIVIDLVEGRSDASSKTLCDTQTLTFILK